MSEQHADAVGRWLNKPAALAMVLGLVGALVWTYLGEAVGVGYAITVLTMVAIDDREPAVGLHTRRQARPGRGRLPAAGRRTKTAANREDSMSDNGNRLEVKQDGKWTVSAFDYVVIKGEYYRVLINDYEGDLYLKEIDEIPDEYWERWNDDA